MKIIRRILFFITLLLVAIAAFLYWGTYEEGVMAGKIIRISQKGVIFKTY
ncbi:MAG: 6-phosphogluconate dehydrogenase, partial [Bacteroidales bacterium]|nr:6-phosphogluconate dehydrogenase [Bacteroidales bacterium]